MRSIYDGRFDNGSESYVLIAIVSCFRMEHKGVRKLMKFQKKIKFVHTLENNRYQFYTIVAYDFYTYYFALILL